MPISWQSLASWRTWRISAPRLEPTSTGSRVVAAVVGEDVWFESDDVQLEPSPEAFASLFMVPALKARVRLEIDAPLDPSWIENTRQLLPILNEWWGFEGRHPIVRSTQSTPTLPQSDRVGQCFTGGVDSFHLLMHQGAEVDYLVFVQGFDIPLDDHGRMDAFETSLREVADRVGKKAIVLRSNIRGIRRFERGGWEHRTHGSALAATGHLLAGSLGRLLIPSTWPRHDTRRYGSSWRTDEFWSSSRTRIEHGDASLSRRDKIPLVATERLAWDHLRVCAQETTPTLNCSRCEKCLRTMVGLERCGALEHFATFDRRTPLPRLLDGLPDLPAHLITTWSTTGGRLPPGELRDAVDRLLERSGP
jgi:hypothetical protein